jgi:hypothetical protein
MLLRDSSKDARTKGKGWGLLGPWPFFLPLFTNVGEDAFSEVCCVELSIEDLLQIDSILFSA